MTHVALSIGQPPPSAGHAQGSRHVRGGGFPLGVVVFHPESTQARGLANTAEAGERFGAAVAVSAGAGKMGVLVDFPVELALWICETELGPRAAVLRSGEFVGTPDVAVVRWARPLRRVVLHPLQARLRFRAVEPAPRHFLPRPVRVVRGARLLGLKVLHPLQVCLWVGAREAPPAEPLPERRERVLPGARPVFHGAALEAVVRAALTTLPAAHRHRRVPRPPREVRQVCTPTTTSALLLCHLAAAAAAAVAIAAAPLHWLLLRLLHF
mmetsp:Transcript_44132/g.86915  ORF Transcript_44132/g.86915 Transcript_44132/m.86915 type:complete len:268 (+) Transcript_44132:36-839(+)